MMENGVMNDGEWHHVAFSMTRGSGGILTLYLDGKIVDQKSCAVNSVSTSFPTIIGTDGRGGASYPRYYSGDLDKVVIFSSALDHAQLFELYAQGRSDTATFAPSASPTTAAPTESYSFTSDRISNAWALWSKYSRFRICCNTLNKL
jgi:hypothetical protein